MLKVVSKWLMSFTKSDWKIEDYPLRYKYQGGGEVGGKKVPNWCVQVINWYVLSGLGETKDEALNDLRIAFEYKKEKGNLPRPGTKVPIEFAPCIRIKEHEEIVRELIQNVLGINYDQCFVSDESTLGDFQNEEVKLETIEEIKKAFNVDISKLNSSNIADIAEYIYKSKF